MKSKSIDKIQEAIEALSTREIRALEPEFHNKTYLRGLNIGQQVAATRKEGNYLVIAGPGTGKTHTLAYRVLHMIKTGTDPQTIVVITFTRKAGNELKNRINLLMPNTVLGFVGTFHGFANHISQMVGTSSPISKFRLLDSEDDGQVHGLVMAEFKGFSKSMRAARLQKIISYCANTGMTPEDYITKFDIRNMMEDIEAIEAYRQVYEAYKVDHMLANYDDMILKISHFMEKEGKEKLKLNYDFLMIDEYQDTNRMQLDFIKRLRIPNVMAIGDDFQGIYAFRGADHRIILDFYNDFEDAHMIKLTQNYRSNNAIVDWVNQTVARSALGYQKALSSVEDSKGLVEVMSGGSLAGHKDFILEKIKATPEEKHALIYRFNKHRTVFEKAMIDEQIDYVVYGGVRLLERKHVKDVLAFLMVYLNRRDVVSFNRLLTLYPGIGPKTARRLMKYELKDTDRLNEEKTAYVGQVRDVLASQVPKEALYKSVIKLYMEVYELIENDYYTYEEIKEDFKMIGDLLETYESLENFIINLILDPVVDLKKGKNPKVVLTTIHSAKGLEFDNVYYFHSHDWYKNYDLEQLEEDRRLFYVGISRAKHHLYVFDHTEIKRPFDSILQDFDKLEMAKAPEPVDVYGSLSASEGLKVEAEHVSDKVAEAPASNVIQVDFGQKRQK